ncbi:MAG TPA: metallophosphoesterase [Rhizomicrobium sp.]|nr:metallophosphoesterase [Rhizomicrobium sp.]
MAAAGLATDAFWLEPSSLRLSRYDVPDNPPPLKGLRIAVISDLHAGSPFTDEEKIDRVVSLTNAARPDLILLTGDYGVSVAPMLGGRHMPVPIIAAHLKPLHAPLGVYAVIGNHDREEDAASVYKALRSVGIDVLENQHVPLSAPHGPLFLAGIGDFHTGASRPTQALAGIAANMPVLCFTHTQDVFPHLPRSCALTIAGHTHGGQVRLPLVGRLKVPSVYGQRYAAGYVREGGKSLFISTGIGVSILPVRFGVPPEVSFLRLK